MTNILLSKINCGYMPHLEDVGIDQETRYIIMGNIEKTLCLLIMLYNKCKFDIVSSIDKIRYAYNNMNVQNKYLKSFFMVLFVTFTVLVSVYISMRILQLIINYIVTILFTFILILFVKIRFFIINEKCK